MKSFEPWSMLTLEQKRQIVQHFFHDDPEVATHIAENLINTATSEQLDSIFHRVTHDLINISLDEKTPRFQYEFEEEFIPRGTNSPPPVPSPLPPHPAPEIPHKFYWSIPLTQEENDWLKWEIEHSNISTDDSPLAMSILSKLKK